MSLVYKIYFCDTDCVCVFKYICPAGYFNLTVQVIKQDCELLMGKETSRQHLDEVGEYFPQVFSSRPTGGQSHLLEVWGQGHHLNHIM